MTALLERTQAAPAGVDEDAGVLRGCRVCGLESANGRRYTPDALGRARKLYEGVRVYLDHADQPQRPRSIRDVIGQLRNVRQDAGGLRGDVHLNRSHPETAQIMWAAKHAPRTLGLSHSATGQTMEAHDGRTVVNEITQVRSVDLVAEPATATSLFESKGKSMSAKLLDLKPREALALIIDATDGDDEETKRRASLYNQGRKLMAEALEGLAGDDPGAVEEAVRRKFVGMPIEERLARWRS